MSTSSSKPRFIKPPNKLKAKVGTGGIDEKLLDKAQNYIQSVDIDFKPTAEQLLANVQAAMKNFEKAQTPEEQKKVKNDIAGAIMQLKANGGMFGYQLMSEISALGLYFIDHIDTINKEAFQVIDVHCKTLHIIIANQLKGDGGQEGYALVKELEKACKRYFDKYPPQH